MKRIISLVSTVMVMAALVLASALPALAATPTVSATCVSPPFIIGFATSDPQSYKSVRDFYKACQDRGEEASIDVAPFPGKPTE